MSINRQEFCNSGRDMLGRANAGESLTISRVVIGSGRATAPSDLWPRIALITHELDVAISQKVDQGDGILLIDAIFNSSQAPRAFELCEVGVMAHLGAEADRLYSVANVMATGADNVDPAVESIHAFKIKVVIDRAPNVTVVIGDSTDILAENIGADTVGPGWFAEKIANTLRFKRAIEGTGIELINNPDTVTIGVKTLKLDLDVYVPVNHSTMPPGSLSFPTIQAAHDYLLQYTIPADRFATIHVDRGEFSVPAGISITHPNSNQISILGATPYVMTIDSVSGDIALNHVYAYGTNTDIGIGDYVGIRMSIGSGVYPYHNEAYISGFFRTIGAFPNAIEYNWIGDPEIDFSGLQGEAVQFKTVLTFPAGVFSGISIFNGLRNLSNIAVVGSGGTFGIHTQGNCNLNLIGARGWTQISGAGIYNLSGLLTADNCFCSGNYHGLVVDDNLFSGGRFDFTANVMTGLYLYNGAKGIIGTLVTAKHSREGLLVSNSSSLLFDILYSQGNSIGIRSHVNSSVSFIHATASFVTHNYSRDITLSCLSSIYNHGGNNMVYDNGPPIGLQADGSYFSPNSTAEEEHEPEQPIERVD